ncbi:MAG: BamA/TamA family outer membrane protein [Bacteroidales bacterium]|jgi:outer membrane protein assembly factor BamA|nr:BamA/TamA family outer membrane protein [Bacteroidales bacterium]MDD2632734.1 BamA/TamA family outer membrane protein [Bacteroidales bacterium]MDD3525520.1 BamA/TamA family outer membrane protein [Bacteroidales bacterium]MDD4178208.1 BamA/TamA family outer membrane protein [Bacteroidales bacterium]MDD4741583.1 BamA/TamA family outer membrane protein [Bacteroidales bacterium]
MKSRNVAVLILLIWALGAITGCTGLGKISDGEYLFTGADIHIDSASLLSNKQKARSQTEALIPATNTKVFWMRPFLAIHNLVKEPKKEKGIRYWIKYKLGEPPVMLADINVDELNNAMENRLVNLGHFSANSGYEVLKKEKTASLDFNIKISRPYYIESITFPTDTTPMRVKIKQAKPEMLLQPGDPYDLSKFVDERERIENVLKDKGYFYFSADYLLFDADTSVGNRQIAVDMKVKPNAPKLARTAYQLRNIYVLDDYSLDNYHPDTTLIDNYFYLSENHYFKPETILDAVFLRDDSLYSRKDHYNTLSHLMGLGIYKYANARFVVTDTARGLMDARFYLTPQKKISLGAQVSAAIKTNNYAGPGLNLSFKNRNTFKAAETFQLNLGGRFETQYSGQYKGETSYEITLNGTLTFPRFVPFRFGRNQSRQYVPNTTISAGGGIYSRLRYYELHSFNTSLGYSWRSTDRFGQAFSPIDISYTNLARSSDEFQEYLDNNPTIKKSFEEQFILGTSYGFTYSTLHLNRKHTFLVSQGADVSGNLAYVMAKSFPGAVNEKEGQYHLLNVPFAQFARLRSEARYFIKTGHGTSVGMRAIIAVGIPYGNSTTMPYVKQFFVGGTNSVRAFRARTVGPGSYNTPDSLDNVFVDQAGDIKLEYSAEYRFPIHSFLKGAFFVDAGNIWLANVDDQRPGGLFDFNNFYKELAIGAGFGLRIDLDFLVIRFDMAFPMRKPYLPEGERWIFKDIQLGSPSWRRENFTLNIAIGYPF